MSDSTIQIIENYIVNNQKDLYRFAYSYVKNKDDALDIVQESIYDAIKNSSKLNKKTKVKSWIFTIVRNNSLTYLKNKKREINYETFPVEQLKVNNQKSVEEIYLHQAIDSLDFKSRELIIMRYFEDLKLKDMASILNINLSTLKSRLYKTMEILESKYKGEVFHG